jgi:hypothetical protein
VKTSSEDNEFNLNRKFDGQKIVGKNSNAGVPNSAFTPVISRRFSGLLAAR